MAVVVLIACLVALPIIAILVLALGTSNASWPSNLPRLLLTTLLYCGGASLIALSIGGTMAWLVTFHDFPGRRLLRWMALLPLALPGYIVSFIYVETFAYAGPVQQFLRDLFGWARPGDYWFPEVRSLGGAMLVMALVLYPYVYLAGLAAFMRQPPNQLHVARTLGRGPLRAFVEVALPQARAALFIGCLLVIMECINDIGAATFFGVSTLTTAVFGLWLDQGDLAGASRLALLLLAAMALLVWLETIAKAHTLRDGKQAGMLVRLPLTGVRGLAAFVAAMLPVLFGFVLPVVMLLLLGARRFDELVTAETLWAIGHSALLASMACCITIALALVLAHLGRWQKWRASAATAKIASLGYALPGTVLGIGLLLPFGQFDQWINGVITGFGGVGPGLLLSGGLFALLYAYATRFLIIPVGQIGDGMGKIPTNIDHVARTLGRRRGYIFRSIHLPLLKPSIIAAALLVFVDAMKELPATLMLRPFDFDTLATRVFTLASLGQFEAAAGPALLIVLAGLVPVIVLFRQLKQTGGP